MYRSLAVEKKTKTTTQSSSLEGTEPGSLRAQRLKFSDGLPVGYSRFAPATGEKSYCCFIYCMLFFFLEICVE